jgi:hypothetical protein
MWSHYSNCHKGYVVGIKPYVFIQNHQRGDGRFGPVLYCSERSRTVLGEWNDHVAFTKSADWSYEKEWRLCTVLKSGKLVSGSNSVYLIDYGMENLVEIIVGFAADEKLGSEIDKLRDAHPEIRLRYARPSSLGFDMLLVDEVPPGLIAEAVRNNPNLK